MVSYSKSPKGTVQGSAIGSFLHELEAPSLSRRLGGEVHAVTMRAYIYTTSVDIHKYNGLQFQPGYPIIYIYLMFLNWRKAQ